MPTGQESSTASAHTEIKHTGSRLQAPAWPIAIGLALVSLAVLVACRFWLAVELPLTDSTEARYAEMARKMVETGNWLMPQHAYGVPYLAKPPFAFWQSALGIELLGVSEIAVRLPILLWSLGFCAVFFLWLRPLLGCQRGLIGVLMLASMLLFYVSTAAVMTDMLLTICAASALMAFWTRQHGGSWLAEAAMYLALGLGLLTKGPLAAVLVLAPIVAWAALTRRAGEVWRRFAWVRGGFLTAAIALPWYGAAEWHYPGFLSYFILGEHFGRFLVPGWSGDLYGFAHELPRGTIWLLYVLALLPWPVLLVPVALLERGRAGEIWRTRRELIQFAGAWAIAPLGLFTLSANVIWPYALPALPATVVLLVIFYASNEAAAARLLGLGCVAAAGVSIGTAWLGRDDALIESHTKKQLIEEIRDRHSRLDFPIYYWGRQYFSAEFYSRGRATQLPDLGAIEDLLRQDRDFSLIIRGDGLDAVPPSARASLDIIDDSHDAILLEPRHGAGHAVHRNGPTPLAKLPATG